MVCAPLLKQLCVVVIVRCVGMFAIVAGLDNLRQRTWVRWCRCMSGQWELYNDAGAHCDQDVLEDSVQDSTQDVTQWALGMWF